MVELKSVYLLRLSISQVYKTTLVKTDRSSIVHVPRLDNALVLGNISAGDRRAGLSLTTLT